MRHDINSYDDMHFLIIIYMGDYRNYYSILLAALGLYTASIFALYS